MIGCNSVCVLLVGRVRDLLCLCTQLFLFQKHLQYKPIAKAIIPNADAEVPMVETVFTFIEDHRLVGFILSFVNVLLC